MSTNLADLLFGAYRRDALALLLLHPETALHLREIARVIGKAPGTLHRELDRLADTGILLRRPVGNLIQYQANVLCPIFDELASIFKKTAGVVDVLRAALEPMAGRIVAAFVYGSVARVDERAGSDLDVMIIGDVTFEDVIGALAPAQDALRRELNPNVYPPAEFAAGLATGEPFLHRVMSDRKLLLIGTDDDLGELAAHRQAQVARGDARGDHAPVRGRRKGPGGHKRPRT
jgi:predicted nucleotidyltransferase